ncbi:MAG: hypothetical protein AAF171_16510 [Cyanobacteria bacterium P01_A01_bin.116]
MHPPKVRSLQPNFQTLTPITAAILIFLSSLSTAQTVAPSAKTAPHTIAHQVEIVENVGATLHIEPNDTPRAGEEVLAWFALTRKGGQTIPLSDCDCTLTIVQPAKPAAPALTPALSAVEAEGYQGIPGATFTFPEVGAYSLMLTGSPKQAGNFNDFEIAFDVTVAAGEAVPTIPENSATELPEPELETANPPATAAVTETANADKSSWIATGIGGIVLLGAIAWAIGKSQRKS